jgi:hypothetical protein
MLQHQIWKCKQGKGVLLLHDATIDLSKDVTQRISIHNIACFYAESLIHKKATLSGQTTVGVTI